VVDKKIPLLTEVYQPKPMAAVENESKQRHDDTALITPELIARIAAHIKPRLEADLAKTVTENVRQALKAELLQELQDEVIHTQASIEARTVDFVDKTKADLKTELPRMYQSSADLVYGNLEQKLAALQSDAELANSTVEQKITSLQIDAVSKADVMLSSGMQAAVENANTQINANVEALQVEVSARMMRDMNAEMNAFQAQAISIHQTQLGQELTNVFESLNQNANTNLQEQARALQADALAQMRSNFIQAMPEIYVSAVAEQQDAVALEISQQLTAEMQAFQAKSFATHQTQLGEALTSSFQILNENAKQDLQAQMSLLQADVLTQMRGTMNEAIPSIYEAAVDEVKAKFVDEMSVQTIQMRDSFLATVNADLPAVQEVIRENIQHILAASLPALENDLRNQLTSELQDLLLTVKFVLPK
jgi:pheromone shutdown protein TraB